MRGGWLFAGYRYPPVDHNPEGHERAHTHTHSETPTHSLSDDMKVAPSHSPLPCSLAREARLVSSITARVECCFQVVYVHRSTC
jgi:hypothetical protein